MPICPGLFGDVKVFFRIYPVEDTNWHDVHIAQDQKSISIRQLRPLRYNSIHSKKTTFKQFQVDGVFYNSSQNDIYNQVMDGIVTNVFQGQNAMVVAYGQTCSGKSSTVGGLHFYYQDRGIMSRVTENVFQMKQTQPKNLEATIEISYIELLPDNKARDLLQPYPCKIDIHTLRNLSRLEVVDEIDVLTYIFAAEGKKEYTTNVLYPSHVGSSILTFYLTVRNMDLSDPYKVESHLHVLDLAGAEIFGSHTSFAKNKNQIGNANYAKMTLDLFAALINGNEATLMRLKERMSIMSRYLGSCLSGQTAMRFIGHIRTAREDLQLTAFMLSFGQQIKGLKSTGLTIHYDNNELLLAQKLEKELARMRKEKILNEMLQNQESRDNIGLERMQQMSRMVMEFVQNKTDEIQLIDLGEVHTVVNSMKTQLNTCESERADVVKQAYEQGMAAGVAAGMKMKKDNGSSGSLKGTRSSSIRKIKSKEDQSSQSAIGKDSRSRNNLKRIGSKTPSGRDAELVAADSKTLDPKSKKQKTSNSSLHKRSLLSKKKSATTESQLSDRRDSKTSTLLSAANLLIPDTYPEYKDALKEYIVWEGSMYKSALESLRAYDNDARVVHKTYTEQVQKLNELMELRVLRKNELLQATMIREFSQQLALDDEGKPIKTELEKRCEENLKQSEDDIVSQQEVVLGVQSEFKLILNMRQQIKNDVKQEFDEFCKEKYTMQAVSLEDINEAVIETDISTEDFCKDEESESHLEELNAEALNIEIYCHMQLLMRNEAEKKALYLKKRVEWQTYSLLNYKPAAL